MERANDRWVKRRSALAAALLFLMAAAGAFLMAYDFAVGYRVETIFSFLVFLLMAAFAAWESWRYAYSGERFDSERMVANEEKLLAWGAPPIALVVFISMMVSAWQRFQADGRQEDLAFLVLVPVLLLFGLVSTWIRQRNASSRDPESAPERGGRGPLAIRILTAATQALWVLLVVSLVLPPDNSFRGFWYLAIPLGIVWFFVALFWLGRRFAGRG